MTDTRFRILLRDTDDTLFHRFRAIEAELQKLLEYSQAGTHLSFTPHGLSHISRLESAYDWLLEPDDAALFNATEIFILLIATYTHDLLMIPRKPGDERRARETHAATVADFLASNRQVNLSDHEAEAIGHVVRGHHVESFDELPDETVLGSRVVRIRMLAACLSMVDICDADERRSPRIVFDYLNLNETSEYHWRRHLLIAGITRRGSELLMSAYYYSPEGKIAVEEYRDQISAQLSRIRPYFSTILRPITGVKLLAERKDSHISTPIAFRADAPAIIRLLIEGVYQRSDVFIRELIQNSLDATYLRQAEAFRRSAHYAPKIIATGLLDEDEDLVAVRIDDNGVGMSIREIRDTLLTIAASQANNQGVQDLMATTGRNLIATFGIGLLSCLKVASSIEIQTRREGEQPIHLVIEDVDSEIVPEVIDGDPPSGSTFIVNLKATEGGEIDLWDALFYYCVQVVQASLYFDLTSDEATFRSESRERVIERASSGDIEAFEPFDPGFLYESTVVEGDGFVCSLWLDDDDSAEDIRQMRSGNVRILNDGLFVTEDSTSDWLPKSLSILDGIINFRAGAINLSASRDAVKSDSLSASQKRELGARAVRVVADIAARTKDREPVGSGWAGATGQLTSSGEIDPCVIAICSINDYISGNRLGSDWLVREISEYVVNMFDGSQRSLRWLAEQGGPIYVTYGSARTVTAIGVFNGHRLFMEPDVEVALEGSLLAERGELVVHADNFPTNDRLNELDLIVTYMQSVGIAVVDVPETHPMEREIRSRGIPQGARKALGSDVKFVEIAALRHQRAWRVGDEIWINTSNPDVMGLYKFLGSSGRDEADLELASILVAMLGCRFDEAASRLLRLLTSER